MHVLEKLDSPGQHVVLDIHDHLVAEDVFVKCFKPTRHMDSSAMCGQFKLWKFQWKADKKPYIILSEGNVVSTFFCKMQVHFFEFTNSFVFLF